ncbi:MAG TPA: hypothetical protein ENI76_10885 [Ignavibacteria bacterium]|nr:hypothetical protein [Ignavibacteria bacterium]
MVEPLRANLSSIDSFLYRMRSKRRAQTSGLIKDRNTGEKEISTLQKKKEAILGNPGLLDKRILNYTKTLLPPLARKAKGKATPEGTVLASFQKEDPRRASGAVVRKRFVKELKNPENARFSSDQIFSAITKQRRDEISPAVLQFHKGQKEGFFGERNTEKTSKEPVGYQEFLVQQENKLRSDKAEQVKGPPLTRQEISDVVGGNTPTQIMSFLNYKIREGSLSSPIQSAAIGGGIMAVVRGAQVALKASRGLPLPPQLKIAAIVADVGLSALMAIPEFASFEFAFDAVDKSDYAVNNPDSWGPTIAKWSAGIAVSGGVSLVTRDSFTAISKLLKPVKEAEVAKNTALVLYQKNPSVGSALNYSKLLDEAGTTADKAAIEISRLMNKSTKEMSVVRGKQLGDNLSGQVREEFNSITTSMGEQSIETKAQKLLPPGKSQKLLPPYRGDNLKTQLGIAREKLDLPPIWSPNAGDSSIRMDNAIKRLTKPSLDQWKKDVGEFPDTMKWVTERIAKGDSPITALYKHRQSVQALREITKNEKRIEKVAIVNAKRRAKYALKKKESLSAEAAKASDDLAVKAEVTKIEAEKAVKVNEQVKKIKADKIKADKISTEVVATAEKRILAKGIVNTKIANKVNVKGTKVVERQIKAEKAVESKVIKSKVTSEAVKSLDKELSVARGKAIEGKITQSEYSVIKDGVDEAKSIVNVKPLDKKSPEFTANRMAMIAEIAQKQNLKIGEGIGKNKVAKGKVLESQGYTKNVSDNVLFQLGDDTPDTFKEDIDNIYKKFFPLGIIAVIGAGGAVLSPDSADAGVLDKALTGVIKVFQKGAVAKGTFKEYAEGTVDQQIKAGTFVRTNEYVDKSGRLIIPDKYNTKMTKSIDLVITKTNKKGEEIIQPLTLKNVLKTQSSGEQPIFQQGNRTLYAVAQQTFKDIANPITNLIMNLNTALINRLNWGKNVTNIIEDAGFNNMVKVIAPKTIKYAKISERLLPRLSKADWNYTNKKLIVSYIDDIMENGFSNKGFMSTLYSQEDRARRIAEKVVRKKQKGIRKLLKKKGINTRTKEGKKILKIADQQAFARAKESLSKALPKLQSRFEMLQAEYDQTVRIPTEMVYENLAKRADMGSMRVALAMEDDVAFTRFPWLGNLMTSKEKVAVSRLRVLTGNIRGEIKSRGGNVMGVNWFHHPLHPDQKRPMSNRLNSLAEEAQNAYRPDFTRMPTRHLGSISFVPDVEYAMARYLPDVTKRLAYMDFWDPGKLGGWLNVRNEAFKGRNTGLQQFWNNFVDSTKPFEETFTREAANTYLQFEIFRLLALSPSVSFKHLIKLNHNMAIFGPKVGIQASASALKLNLKQAFSAVRKSAGYSELKFSDFEQIVINRTKIDNILEVIADAIPGSSTPITDLKSARFGSVEYLKAGAQWLNHKGSLLVRGVEQYDRSVSVVGSMLMVQKRGMTATEAHFAITDMILKSNGVAINNHPVWLRDPNMKALFMFNGTVFRIFEQNLDMFSKTAKVSKNTAKIALRETKKKMLDASYKFKWGSMQEAWTKEKDIFDTPVANQFIKKLLLLGGAAMGADKMLDINLYNHVFHLPLLDVNLKGGVGVRMNPLQQSMFEAGRQTMEDNEEPSLFALADFFKRTAQAELRGGSIYKFPKMFNYDELPSIYNREDGDPVLEAAQYLFAVPSSK